MNHEMTIEYLKCRADLNFKVDFRVNGAIGTIVISAMEFYYIQAMNRFHP